MAHFLHVTAWIIAAAPLCIEGGAARAGPGPLSPRATHLVIVRFGPDVAVRAVAVGATGVAGFDALCRELGATSLVPLLPAAHHRRPDLLGALGLDRTVRLSLDGHVTDAEASARLMMLAEVELAAPAALAHKSKTPNDPLFGSQWSLQNGKLSCPRAWNIETSSIGVPVAVLDTGADQQHSDLKDNRWVNTGETAGNGVDDDGNGYVDDRFGFDFVNRDGNPDDDDGHGTHVSGIVGATGDNFNSICGICWTAELMSLKVLDASGQGFLVDVAEGLVYAADNGARVANMSLESDSDDPTLRAAVDYADALDLVQVAAAGNDGSNKIQYPAGYAAVIAAIATDDTDQRWPSSNFGSWCDLSAPGVNIISLKNHGGTLTQSGTSEAAPHIAAVAALCRKVNPGLDATAVRLVLQLSATDLGMAGFDTEFAWGRLEAERSLKTARALAASAPTVASGSPVRLDLNYPDDAGFLYVLLPSTQGRVPGIGLKAFDPNDARNLPLNPDWLQTWTVLHPVNGIFQSFLGALDAGGLASATFLPLPHLWDGVAFDFAYITLDPADLAHIVHLSNPCRIGVE